MVSFLYDAIAAGSPGCSAKETFYQSVVPTFKENETSITTDRESKPIYSPPDISVKYLK